MPLISVIVPTRKRNHLLPRALNSLFVQTFADFEIIIVDDNDADARIAGDPSLESLLQESRVRVIEHEKPRNAATARNCGLRAARGEWITYLDDDDAYHPAKLEKQLQCAHQTNLPLGLCGLAYNLRGRRRLKQTSRSEFCGEDLLLDSSPGTEAIFHRNTRLVFFDESLEAAEDAHFFFKLVKQFQVNCVFNVPEALIEVYPQPSARVNLNGAAIRRASEAIYNEFASSYGEKAAKIYITRIELQMCKFEPVTISKTFKLSVDLITLRGLRDWRLIVNTLAFKIPFLRRFLVT